MRILGREKYTKARKALIETALLFTSRWKRFIVNAMFFYEITFPQTTCTEKNDFLTLMM